VGTIKRYTLAGALLFLALAITGVAYMRPGLAGAAPRGADIPEITIQGHDFAFCGPDQVDAGKLAITLTNDGHEPHQANLGRLADGKTLDDFMAALKQGEGPALAMLEFVGGPNTIDPGARQRVVVSVTAGNYLLLCFVPSPDGVPHIAKGMLKPLTVVAGTGQDAPAAPTAAGEASLKDFLVTLPATIKAGKQTWNVVNQGPEPHELTLIKLADGKTLDDIKAYMQKPAGPPPFSDAGGMGALMAGKNGWFDIDLTPGNYIALCFIPSPANNGKAHFAMGMITPFTVAASGPVVLPSTGTASSNAMTLLVLIGALVLLAGAAIAWRRLRAYS
jgi:LPXTG-motif cell wall-anchored protein